MRRKAILHDPVTTVHRQPLIRRRTIRKRPLRRLAEYGVSDELADHVGGGGDVNSLTYEQPWLASAAEKGENLMRFRVAVVHS